MKNLYTIYYLPNCKREGYINSKGEPQVGKVGCTIQLTRRIYYNKKGGYDITNWKILEQKEMTKEEALKLEYQYQLEYDCLDNSKQTIVKLKQSISAYNRPPVTYETRLKISNLHKGRKFINRKKRIPVTSETKEKSRISNLGQKRTSETKEKISKAAKNRNPVTRLNTNRIGSQWFTNGIINKICKECPFGFYKGKIRIK